MKGGRSSRVVGVRKARITGAVATALAVLLAQAPAAMAADGLGTAGRVGDKTITLFCFGVLAFFVLLVSSLSFVQGKLEARKDRRRYDLERLS